MRLLGIDDGLWNGNYNAADIFFLIATLLAVVATALYISVRADLHRWAPALVAFAVACISFGWLLL